MYEWVGYISAIIVAVSYFAKDDTFCILQTIANLCICVCFWLRGLPLSAIGTLVATLRTICMSITRGDRLGLVSIFCILHAIVGFLGFDTMYDLIYIVGLEMFTISFLIRDRYVFRCALLVPNILYVVYKLMVGTIGSMIGSLIETLAIVVYMIRRRDERIRDVQIVR